MRSIALANQKGGVGKTTTAIHLAHGLSLRGERVLLLDLDPQGNAVVALQADPEPAEEGSPFQRVSDHLWIEGNFAHDVPDEAFLRRLKADIDALAPDWLIVDCPPRMDAWGLAGLKLCSEVIVPVQAEFLAMHGLSQILATLEGVKDHCKLLGVLPTMVDMREQICAEVVGNLRAHLGEQVFETVILRDSTLVEAASHGQSVFHYAPGSKAAFCYGELILEVCDG